MNHSWKSLLFAALFGTGLLAAGLAPDTPHSAAAQSPQAAAPVFAGGETLKYKLLWPAGIYLGEATLTVTPAGSDLRLDLTVEADLPVHDIVYSFTSVATRDGLCSSHFQKKGREGARASEESIEFDQKAHLAHRTRGSQSTSSPIPECARDPLTFFYYFRSQIAAGAPVNAATFFIAPGTSLEINTAGAQTVTAGGKQRQGDKYLVTYHTANSARNFELWVSADSTRAPVLVRMPFPLALFSAELQ